MVGTAGCATAIAAAGLGAGRSPLFCGGVGEGLAMALAPGADACSASAGFSPAPTTSSNVNAKYLLFIITPYCTSQTSRTPQRCRRFKNVQASFPPAGEAYPLRPYLVALAPGQ